MDSSKHTFTDKLASNDKKVGWLEWLVAIGPPFLIGVPLICFLLILYLGTEESVFLILSIICFVLAVLYVVFFVRSLKKPMPPSRSNNYSSYEEEEEKAAAGAAMFLGMLGGFFLGKSSHRKGRD